MRNDSKRIEGVAEELGGKIRGRIGRLIGNERMQAAGKARELEGVAKQQSAKAAERFRGKMEQVVGAVKYRMGTVLHNKHLRATGHAESLRGVARRNANR
jgi:uncharacterized protein YjbJ (UPF0337 family)